MASNRCLCTAVEEGELADSPKPTLSSAECMVVAVATTSASCSSSSSSTMETLQPPQSSISGTVSDSVIVTSVESGKPRVRLEPIVWDQPTSHGL